MGFSDSASPGLVDALAWVCVRDGRVLKVRSRGKDVFYLPGGKREPGESDAAALVREQTAQWRQVIAAVPQPAGAGEAAAAPRSAPAAAPAPVAGARLEIAPAAAAEGAQATRSGLGAGGEGDMLANEQLRQAREDLAARDSELQELRSRVEELEKLHQQQMRLIELKDSELAAAQQRLAQLEQQQSAGGTPLWLWGGLGLLVVAAVVWWLGRRPKPLPIPVQRGTGFDAASLAAAVPGAAPADPAVAVDAPEESHHAAWTEEAPAWHTAQAPDDVAPLNPLPAGRERLELAIAYLDLGDVETARTLLNEVVAGADPAAREEAAQLLREIG